MTYCQKCGNRVYDSGHVCDEAGIEAMRRNPMLALLIRRDGKLNPDAPVILGPPDDPTFVLPPAGRGPSDG